MYSRDHRSTVKKLSSSKIKNCTAKKKSYYEKSAKLNNAFSDTIKIMNYIKTNAFHLRVFSLCDNMEAYHQDTPRVDGPLFLLKICFLCLSPALKHSPDAPSLLPGLIWEPAAEKGEDSD